MRAVIYARVSSQLQRDKHTIDSQLSTLPTFITARGWQLVGTYVDDGKTAKAGHLERREGFQRLLRDMAARAFDVVVMVDQDRLTRSEDLRERGEVLGAFQRAGVQIAIASTGQVLDLASSMGDLMSGLQAFFAAEENRKRRERTVRGKLEAIRQGRKPSGPTPFGLRYDGATHEWSIDTELGPIVLELFTRVAAGESCEPIARDLQLRGIRRARGGLWNRERVWQIITARTYLGKWTADRARKLTVDVPAIVTEDLYEAAQEALKRYGKRGLRRTKHIYLCEELGFCKLCQAPIGMSSSNGWKGGRKQTYYVCSHRRRPVWGQPRCTFPMRRVEPVDERVWASVAAALERPDHLERAIERQRVLTARGASDWQKDLAAAERALARLQRAEQAILERFSRDLVSEEAMDAELERLAKERRLQAHQVETAKRQAAGARQELAHGAAVLATLATLRSRLDGATLAEKRALVLSLVPRRGIELGADGSIEVTLVFREDPPVALARAAGSRTEHESSSIVLKVVA